jgi:hypothetical protein
MEEEEEEEEEGSEYFSVYSTCKWFMGVGLLNLGLPRYSILQKGVKSLPHAN